MTNGITWWFYLPLNEGSWEERKFFSIDILQQETSNIASRFIEFLAKENIENGKAIENAEKAYKGQQKQNILKKTLPEAWNKIICEPDELLVELINETTEKLCGHKTNNESIKQFIIRHKRQFLLSGEYQYKNISHTKPKPPVSRESENNKGHYTGKKPSCFYFRSDRHEVNSWKDLLMAVLEIIYRKHPGYFEKVLSLKGTKRAYFAYSKKGLTNPKKIVNTGIFAEAHISANDIVKRCYQLLELFGYNENDLTIETH